MNWNKRNKDLQQTHLNRGDNKFTRNLLKAEFGSHKRFLGT